MYHIDMPPAPGGKQEFLSFQLGGLEYGVEFGKVKELRSLGSLGRGAADGGIVKGVAVSRGVVMPLVDMRAAFAGPARASAALTDVIVLQLSSCVMGMVVDGVTDVVRIDADAISSIPGARGGAGTQDCDYLIGLGETAGRRLILVDIDRLMAIRKEERPARAAA